MNSKGISKAYGGAIRVNVCDQGSPGSARLMRSAKARVTIR